MVKVMASQPAGALRSATRPPVLLTASVLAGGVAALLAWTGAGSAARWTVLIVAGAVVVWLAVDMIRDLLHGRMGIDILAATAIAATLVVGEYAAAMVVVVMLTGGRALEEYASGRARRELSALLAAAPRSAHVVGGGVVRDVPIGEVMVGDVVLVRPAEAVPVDGVLVTAAAVFDESSLTGESLPAEHVAGDQVLSGVINGTRAVTITATATAAESQYAQIVKLVSEATHSRPPMVRLADRYSVPFTIVSYAIAVTAWIVADNADRFAAVLVVATPCPLLIAAPVAFLGGMSRAAGRGIIVKSASALEVAARVRTVAFDKTGTLTQGRPVLSRIISAEWIDPDRLLALAAAAEQHSSHVLAESVMRAARDRGMVLQAAEHGTEWATHGVVATIDGHRVRVGKPAFVAQTGAVVPDLALTGGEVAVHVGVDDMYAGALLLADSPRPEAAGTVERLRELGVRHTLMISGDAVPTAVALARRIGITDVRAECLPADKVAVIRSQTDRPVMMIGDGVNDAPVLAAADVGVAMGARGATAAAQSADVVILPDRLDLAADTVTIGRRTVLMARQSIGVGIALSVGLMVVAAFGALPALWGAISQEAVDVVAIANALRALTQGRGESARPPGGDVRPWPA
jgi:heavy metal translocating P-type ATPase